MDPLAAPVIDAAEAISGVHAGARRLHAKGVLCHARFTATQAGTALTRAAHFDGRPRRAHVRFSNANGAPDVHDAVRGGRGLAVKVYLDDGATTDFVATTTPAFVARNPDDFLELMEARKPDPATGEPDMARVGAYLEAHPEALPAISAALGKPPPASYAQIEFNGLHAYGLVDAAGGRRWGRFHWAPAAGTATIDDDEARALEPDYLAADIEQRLASEPVRFALWVSLAEDGDPLDDPTAMWPPERERAHVADLEITALAFDRETDGDVLVFDPVRVADGIELSDDPILLFRTHAYRESVTRRTA